MRINRFKQAVAATPDVRNCYQPGLQALGNYSTKVEYGDSGLLEGSVDIDACTTEKYPQANRWDYAIGYASYAYFVEVHTANDSEVETVARKLQWLKDWLASEAPELQKIKAKPVAYYWVRSGNKHLKASKYVRKAAALGIFPITKLTLP